MKTQELKIYNKLIEALFDLEEEGYENRENIVRFVIENFIISSDWLKDPEICERISILVDSSIIATKVLGIIATSTEHDFEIENTTNLGRNYSNTILINNLYIAHDKYLDLLGNYRIYKLEGYHPKYLVENKLNSLSVEKEIKETDKILIRNFDLKI